MIATKYRATNKKFIFFPLISNLLKLLTVTLAFAVLTFQLPGKVRLGCRGGRGVGAANVAAAGPEKTTGRFPPSLSFWFI